jgi:hypothetical protein
MPETKIAVEKPKFAALLESLTVETERFRKAVVDKQRLLAELGEKESISIEDRRLFLQYLKEEQAIYHGIQSTQEEVIDLLREASRK